MPLFALSAGLLAATPAAQGITGPKQDQVGSVVPKAVREKPIYAWAARFSVAAPEGGRRIRQKERGKDNRRRVHG